MNYTTAAESMAMNRNKLYTIIKQFRDAFPANFEESGLKVCKYCEGSGIPVKPNQDGVTFWNPGTFCDKCNGFGVTGIKQIYNEFICKKCKGTGCVVCNHKGTVDWITNAVKR